MRGDEFMRGVAVAVFTPALGEHEFFLRLQHWEPADFFEVARKSAFSGKGGKRSSLAGQSGLLFWAPRIGGPQTAALSSQPQLAHIGSACGSAKAAKSLGRESA